MRNALWKGLYTHPRPNVIDVQKPDTIIRNNLRYTGTINTRPINDSLILLANLGMSDKGRLIQRTRRVLRSKNGYSHHILRRTWNPADDDNA